MLKFSDIFEFSRTKFLFCKNSNGSNGSNGWVPRRSNLSTLAQAVEQQLREQGERALVNEHLRFSQNMQAKLGCNPGFCSNINIIIS